MKITLLVLSHLVLAGLGLFGGLVVGTWQIRESYREEQIAAGGWPMLAWYSSYVMVRREGGDDSRYRESLLEFDAALEKRGYSGDPPISRTMYHTYRMLNNTRLSQIEHAAGNLEAADRHMALAANHCAMMTWDDCTAEALGEVAERLDAGL